MFAIELKHKDVLGCLQAPAVERRQRPTRAAAQKVWLPHAERDGSLVWMTAKAFKAVNTLHVHRPALAGGCLQAAHNLRCLDDDGDEGTRPDSEALIIDGSYSSRHVKVAQLRGGALSLAGTLPNNAPLYVVCVSLSSWPVL
jgi:hypothetical protein